MRQLLPGFIACLFFSCSTVSSPPDKEVPKAFDNEQGLTEIKSYRGGGGDVVNAMYDEAVDHDAVLRALEKDIRNNADNIGDAKKTYNSFVYNNSNYYTSAAHHLNNIGDTALRESARAKVEKSRLQYERSVAGFAALIRQIDWKQASLNDVHTFLKLARTLPAIESYQNSNMPDKKALENAAAELDRLIQRTKDAGKQ